MADPPDQPAPLTSKQIELLRYQARLDLWKVVAGTMIVGIAVAFFPFAQKYAEVSFQTKIEEIKAQSAKEILAETNRLEKEKIDYQAEKDEAESLRVEGVALREFLNALGTEGRSSDIETRIRLAEYFSFVLPSTDQSSNWVGFRDYLLELRARELERRRAALKVQLDPNSSELERALAAADVVEIDRTLTPSLSSTPGVEGEVAYESLGIDRKSVNGDMEVPKRTYLLEMFGPPTAVIGNGCGFPDKEPLKSQTASVSIGETRAILITPAAASLEGIMARIAKENPEIAAQVQSLGGWCVRYVRGSTTQLSNHSFGTAIDISIGGRFGLMGNNKVSPALAAIAPYFMEAGWYWGAGFPRDEPGHFEVSRQQIEKWVKEGKLKTLKPLTDE